MSDLVFDLDPETGLFDLAFRDATLATGDDLVTPVLVSLFTDARARADDPPPATADDDRRGWWGDAFPAPGAPADDRTGSRLWLLARELQTPETLVRARQYVEECLAWMVEDGIAAAVTGEASYPQPGWLVVGAVIDRPDGGGVSVGWAVNWEAQAVRPAVAGRIA